MKASIVIVNWNTGKLLTECLQSIAKLPDVSAIAEVIVVDNNSADSSFVEAKKVELAVPTMMMGLHKNIGFAAANNMAIRQRRQKDSHVFLLNPDTQILTGALESALQELQHNEQAGIVGVKLLNIDNSIQPSVRTFPTMAVFIFFFLKLRYFFPKARTMTNYFLPQFDYAKRQTVAQVMGAAFLIRNSLLNDIGLLDENFWVWFEEVDYCKRATKAGWGVVYVPTGSILHHGGASFHQRVGLKKTIPFLNSCLHYAKKHLNFGAYLLLVVLWLPAVIISLPAALVHLKKRENNKTKL